MLRIAASSLFVVLMSLPAAAGDFEQRDRNRQSEARHFEHGSQPRFDQLAQQLGKATHRLRHDAERAHHHFVTRAQSRMLYSLRGLEAAVERFQYQLEHREPFRATRAFNEVRRSYELAVRRLHRVLGHERLGHKLDHVGEILDKIDHRYASASIHTKPWRAGHRGYARYARYASWSPLRSGGWR